MMQILDECRHIAKGSFIVLILIVPLAVAAAFGYVYKNNSVQEAPLAVVDLDHSTYSNQLLVKLDSSQYVKVLDVYNNFVAADMLLYNEKYSGVLYLPAGMETACIQGKSINLGLDLDMTMSAVAATVRSGVSEVIATENASRGLTVLALEQRSLYNPTNSTIMSTVMMFVNVIMLSFIAINTLAIAPRLRQSGAQVPYCMLPGPLQMINQVLPLSLHFKFLRGMGYKGGQFGYFIPEIGHYLLIISLFCAVILLLMCKESLKLAKAEADSEASLDIAKV